MSRNLTAISVNTPETAEFLEVDGLIKFIIATLLTVMPFFFLKTMSFVMISIYLLLVTYLSRIKPRTLLISAASYFMVVLMPYLFGLLMNGIIYAFSNNELFSYQQGPNEIFLRLFKLLIIWYVSILYFHTTPMKTVLGLLDKCLTPLKLVGVPIADYLKVVMGSVIELKEMGAEIMKSLEESVRSVVRARGGKFNINIKGLSQIIVSLIVNSFGRLDKIERFVEQANPDDLYHYSFKLTRREIVVVLSFVLFTSLVFMVEKGYWF